MIMAKYCIDRSNFGGAGAQNVFNSRYRKNVQDCQRFLACTPQIPAAATKIYIIKCLNPYTIRK